MTKWFSNNLLYIIGAVAGGVAGYLYWQQIGCSSGTCAITSKPLNSTLYGAVMGALLFGMFKKQIKTKNEKQINDI
jgi:ABC-type branched-subunit amino acid transport system permease subunit